VEAESNMKPILVRDVPNATLDGLVGGFFYD